MSNANVVASIAKLLERFEKRQLSPTELDDQLEDYISALEGLRGEHLRQVRDISTRLVKASFADEDYPGENPVHVLGELRAWLNSVPK